MIAVLLPPSICKMPRKKRRNAAAKFKKAPGAPRRFKSAYMFFSIAKNKEIRDSYQHKLVTTEVAKMVSQAWKSLTPEERAVWDNIAREDKERYEREKADYKGPWKILVEKPRSKKQEAPTSAFGFFCDEHKALVKAANPNATNVELSGIISKMWQEAGPTIKKLYSAREDKHQEDDASTQDMSESESSNEDVGGMPTSKDALHPIAEHPISCETSLDLSNSEDDWLTGRIQAVQNATIMQTAEEETPSSEDDGALSEVVTSALTFSYESGSASPLPFLEEPTGLAPLTETDSGNFLAVAAALDVMMMESLPFSVEEQELLDAQTEMQDEDLKGLGIDEVLLALPDDCVNEMDLPQDYDF